MRRRPEIKKHILQLSVRKVTVVVIFLLCAVIFLTQCSKEDAPEATIVASETITPSITTDTTTTAPDSTPLFTEITPSSEASKTPLPTETPEPTVGTMNDLEKQTEDANSGQEIVVEGGLDQEEFQRSIDELLEPGLGDGGMRDEVIGEILTYEEALIEFDNEIFLEALTKLTDVNRPLFYPYTDENGELKRDSISTSDLIPDSNDDSDVMMFSINEDGRLTTTTERGIDLVYMEKSESWVIPQFETSTENTGLNIQVFLSTDSVQVGWERYFGDIPIPDGIKSGATEIGRIKLTEKGDILKIHERYPDLLTVGIDAEEAAVLLNETGETITVDEINEMILDESINDADMERLMEELFAKKFKKAIARLALGKDDVTPEEVEAVINGGEPITVSIREYKDDVERTVERTLDMTKPITVIVTSFPNGNVEESEPIGTEFNFFTRIPEYPIFINEDGGLGIKVVSINPTSWGINSSISTAVNKLLTQNGLGSNLHMDIQDIGFLIRMDGRIIEHRPLSVEEFHQ